MSFCVENRDQRYLRNIQTLAQQEAEATEASHSKQPLCANLQGFSLHARVRSAAWERRPLERLCRYITRPALANDRFGVNEPGQEVLKLKTPCRDGTTHQVMIPLEFMQKLTVLVPRTRKAKANAIKTTPSAWDGRD